MAPSRLRMALNQSLGRPLLQVAATSALYGEDTRRAVVPQDPEALSTKQAEGRTEILRMSWYF